MIVNKKKLTKRDKAKQKQNITDITHTHTYPKTVMYVKICFDKMVGAVLTFFLSVFFLPQ